MESEVGNGNGNGETDWSGLDHALSGGGLEHGPD
jgi:hypothetical protein